MKQLQLPESPTQNSDALAEGERVLLERAAEKVVRFGQQVGVTREDMIQLMDSGISVRDLLAFLASKTRESLRWHCTKSVHVVRCPYCATRRRMPAWQRGGSRASSGIPAVLVRDSFEQESFTPCGRRLSQGLSADRSLRHAGRRWPLHWKLIAPVLLRDRARRGPPRTCYPDKSDLRDPQAAASK